MEQDCRKQKDEMVQNLVRLPDGVPAKLALKEAERQFPMPRGRRRTIWLDVMKNNN